MHVYCSTREDRFIGAFVCVLGEKGRNKHAHIHEYLRACERKIGFIPIKKQKQTQRKKNNSRDEEREVAEGGKINCMGFGDSFINARHAQRNACSATTTIRRKILHSTDVILMHLNTAISIHLCQVEEASMHSLPVFGFVRLFFLPVRAHLTRTHFT